MTRPTRWVVVGGGSAGCVVASRLGEEPSNDVTLLEAGPDHAGSFGRLGEPVLDVPALRSDLAVVRRRGGRPEVYAQGRGLGGSSLINGGVVVGDADAESAGHELPIEPVTELGPVASAALELTPDAAAVGLVGRAGRRVTAAEAYLGPARERGDLTVSAASSVARVELDRDRPVGVVLSNGRHVDADRVVLCAGAVMTPVLLLRSGVATTGIGAGLQDHVAVAFSFDVVDPSPDAPAIGATVERPGRQLVLMDRIPGRPHMGAVVAGRLRVRSVGRVTSSDPDAPPVVELNQLDAPEDLDGLVEVADEALALIRRLSGVGAVGRCYVDHDGTTVDELADTPGALRAWLPHHLGGYHHLSASCRLGGPLGPDGAVVGYEHLFVADASALPGVPQRNPYLAVIRQAERLARGWSGRRAVEDARRAGA